MMPNIAATKNAPLNPMASDKKPIMGGPIKKPKNPIEETEASAILA